MDLEDKIYSDLINLIRVSSGRFAAKFKSRYDYLDFYDDGVWILGLCMVKWKEKGKSFEDSIGFKKYFKTSLFNRFRQLEVRAFCKKSSGIKVSFDVGSVSRRGLTKSYGKWSQSEFPELNCDGGFGEVLFKELTDHISNFLNEREKRVFNLMADPPEELVKIAIYQNSRKKKASIINGSYDAHKVKVSSLCLYQFLARNGETITRKELSDIISSIREVVAKILMKRS